MFVVVSGEYVNDAHIQGVFAELEAQTQQPTGNTVVRLSDGTSLTITGKAPKEVIRDWYTRA